ncbi:MAG: ABC transporter substrate-binding protein [Alphaproteobacteria bacterium]|nr:ABC transporter substrate-binding protein [Alphaproteobacteria bacterium]
MLWAALALAVAAMPARADEPVPIAIGAQQGLYGSLPLFVASEKDWWAPAGLLPEIVTWPSAAEQLVAGGDQIWDVAVTDPLSAVLGADRFGLMTVGIADDESDANVVMARPKLVDAVFKNPASLKGKTLELPPDTTAEYAALGCLSRWRLKRQDVRFVALDPARILAGFARGEDRLAALAAPDNYRLYAAGAGITVCSGRDAEAVIPGALVARSLYAAEHPERVARFLAVIFRAIAWEKAHRDETLALLRHFQARYLLSFGHDVLNREVETRPTFTLAEQLQLLDRSKNGVSTGDAWYARLAAYAVAAGLVQAPPIGDSFLTDRYVRWVDGDPALKALVTAE